MRLITQLDSLVDAEQTEQTPGCLFSGGMSPGELNRIENASITGQGRMQSSARLLPAPMLIREVRPRETCEFEFLLRVTPRRSSGGIQFRHGIFPAKDAGKFLFFPSVRTDYFWSLPIYWVLGQLRRGRWMGDFLRCNHRAFNLSTVEFRFMSPSFRAQWNYTCD